MATIKFTVSIAAKPVRNVRTAVGAAFAELGERDAHKARQAAKRIVHRTAGLFGCTVVASGGEYSISGMEHKQAEYMFDLIVLLAEAMDVDATVTGYYEEVRGIATARHNVRRVAKQVR